MQELGNALGRFVGGLCNVDEVRGTFRNFLRQHPEQQAAVASWLRDGVQSGRISSAVFLVIGDLVEAPPTYAPAAAPTPTPTPTPTPAPRKRDERPSEDSTLARVVPLPARSDTAATRAPGSRSPQPTPAPWVATPVGPPASTDAPAADPPPDLPDPGTLHVGSVLDGRYTLVAEIGRGGMGTVYKARDRNRDEFQDRHPFIALKVLSEEFASHPDARMALQRETVRAQSLAHPNIVTVYDFDYDGAFAYMTMELLEGQPLSDWLQGDAFGTAPFARRWSIVHAIGNGLAYAHEKGVVHSDLKPANAFICRNGAVKVMDFGIARPLRAVAGQQQDTTLFDAAERLGGLTPAYAALEQWSHEEPDPRDDIYAFACVVYAVFSGQHPFANASAKKAYESGLTPPRIESLTRRQWDALRRGLAFKREDRTPSVEQFLREFAPRTWLQKYRVVIAGVATIAGALLLALSANFFRDYIEDEVLRMQSRPRAVTKAVVLTAEQKRDVADLLFLAEDTLQQAKDAKSDDDLAYLLTEGANNANQVLDSVFALDGANTRAAQLKEEAVRLYQARARALIDQKKWPDAMRIVGYALKVQPDSRDLFRLKKEICDNNAESCAGT